jgi:glycosyltransferase involved in cell wall biosynthesis
MINNFSVVIPVFNEEVIFLDSAIKIYNFCLEVGKPFEIIFSENGSSDDTVNLIQNFINDKDNCFMIRNDKANYGLALKNGFENAKNDLVVSFDIDYFSQKFLEQSLKLNDEFAAIIASKRMAESEDKRTIVRKIATSTFVLILKILFKTSLSDTHGMKAIRRVNVQKEINNVISTQDIFDTELLIRIEKSGFKIQEVPAKVNEVRPSVSIIFKRIPRTLKSLFKLRYQLFKESLKTNNL